jgi:hypothetical protein
MFLRGRNRRSCHFSWHLISPDKMRTKIIPSANLQKNKSVSLQKLFRLIIDHCQAENISWTEIVKKYNWICFTKSNFTLKGFKQAYRNRKLLHCYKNKELFYDPKSEISCFRLILTNCEEINLGLNKRYFATVNLTPVFLTPSFCFDPFFFFLQNLLNFLFV